MQTDGKKLFLGGRLKRLRRDLGLTQTAMANDLGVSPSYLNHMERNQRPVTAQMLLRLAEVFDLDLRSLASEGGGGEAELSEVFADPMFRDLTVPRHEIVQLAEDSPGAAEGLVRLYRTLLDVRRREAMAASAAPGAEGPLSPADWVRDYVQAQRNYFPEIEMRCEAIAAELAPEPGGFEAAARARLLDRHKVQVRILPGSVMMEWTRRFDLHRNRLLLSELLGPSSRAFACAYQIAQLEIGPDIEMRVESAAAPDLATRRLLKVALNNAAAGALFLPYGPFLATAEELAYDIALIQARFGASFEQVAHRLTTLDRPGARGVPFFFLRADQAGNISKRFANESFPFSRFGGACPRWKLHAAFRSPGQILTQIIETPDGMRWFTLARTVPRPVSTHDDSSEHDLAIGLGCELRFAHKLVYARGADLENPSVTEIGPTCMLCERHPCRERAAPPATRTLVVEEWNKSVSPYPFAVDASRAPVSREGARRKGQEQRGQEVKD